jgi:transglutaminase/protease-like cytokinesis protein 3
MQGLNTFLIEKLKISKNTNTVSFTFNELCDSILRFVNTHTSTGEAYKYEPEYVVKFYKLDYFSDNPLIINDEKPIKSMFRLQGCQIGTMIFNTKYPDHITCHTTNRSITLKDNGSVDQSFAITEENFNKVFNNDELEKLYQVLNEEV